MSVHELAKFEVALQDLAKLHGFELVEVPALSHGLGGIRATASGTAFWTMYDTDGAPTINFAVHFRPIK